MVICQYCTKDVCKPCLAIPGKHRKVVVATDTELARHSHFHRLAMATSALGLSRREVPNWMADVIFGFEGQILWPDGTAFVVGDEEIDLAFNDDRSFRWLSDFLRFAAEPPKQKPQERLIARLRLIDLSFRIASPDRAKWIAA